MYMYTHTHTSESLCYKPETNTLLINYISTKKIEMSGHVVQTLYQGHMEYMSKLVLTN